MAESWYKVGSRGLKVENLNIKYLGAGSGNLYNVSLMTAMNYKELPY